MPDKYQPVDAEQWGGANFGGVEQFLDLAESRFGKQGAHLGDKAAGQLLAQNIGDQPGDRLAGFQQHVTSEAIRDNHVSLTAEELFALDVADKIQAAVLDQWKGFLDQLIAFTGFLAIGEQPEAVGRLFPGLPRHKRNPSQQTEADIRACNLHWRRYPGPRSDHL